MTLAAVRSKVLVLLLLIHCILLLPLFVGIASDPCIIMQCSMPFLILQSSY